MGTLGGEQRGGSGLFALTPPDAPGTAKQNTEAKAMLILLLGACPTQFLYHLHSFFPYSLSLLPVSSSRTKSSDWFRPDLFLIQLDSLAVSAGSSPVLGTMLVGVGCGDRFKIKKTSVPFL